jgi:membrane-bound lytic murein transglycosylase D
MGAMQVFINSSKILLLAALSFSLVIVCSSKLEVPGLMPLVEETSHVTHADSIWNSIRQELTLDHKTQSSQVQKQIQLLLADPDKLYSILKAAAPYIYYIHKQTQARGLPAELALIPVIESEFNPNDHSNKGATGLWQLMPQTARDLGVNVKSGYDGRRNVVASTNAALAYFNDLGNNFKGNWYLAIAAYNCGEYKIIHAQRNAGSHNFFDLSLPTETKLYVPKLLAVAEIIKNPEKYGVQLPPIQDKPVFSEVKVKQSVNLVKIAKTTGVSIDTLKTLNPDYNHGPAPSPTKKGNYSSVLVPVNKVKAVKENLPESVVV